MTTFLAMVMKEADRLARQKIDDRRGFKDWCDFLTADPDGATVLSIRYIDDNEGVLQWSGNDVCTFRVIDGNSIVHPADTNEVYAHKDRQEAMDLITRLTAMAHLKGKSGPQG